MTRSKKSKGVSKLLGNLLGSDLLRDVGGVLLKNGKANGKSKPKRGRARAIGNTTTFKSTDVPAGVSTFTAGRPIFSSASTGCVRLRHTERWTRLGSQLNESQVFTNVFIPGNSGLPVLDHISRTFDRYQLHAATVHFRTSMGTQQNGSIIIGVDWDADDRDPTFTAGVESYYPNVRTAVWKDVSLTIPSDRIMSRKYLKVTSGTLAPGTLYDYAPFKLHTGVESDQSSTAVGDIWISYDITLDGPAVPDVNTLGGFVSRKRLAATTFWITPATEGPPNIYGIGTYGNTFTVDSMLNSTGGIDLSNSSVTNDISYKGAINLATATPGTSGLFYDNTGLGTYVYALTLNDATSTNLPSRVPMVCTIDLLGPQVGISGDFYISGVSEIDLPTDPDGVITNYDFQAGIALLGGLATAPTEAINYARVQQTTYSFVFFIEQQTNTFQPNPVVYYTFPYQANYGSDSTAPYRGNFGLRMSVTVHPLLPFNYAASIISSAGTSSSVATRLFPHLKDTSRHQELRLRALKEKQKSEQELTIPKIRLGASGYPVSQPIPIRKQHNARAISETDITYISDAMSDLGRD